MVHTHFCSQTCPRNCSASFSLAFMMLYKRFHPVSTISRLETSSTLFQCALPIFSHFPACFAPLFHAITPRYNTKVLLTSLVDFVYRNAMNSSLAPQYSCTTRILPYSGIILLYCALHLTTHIVTH